MNDQMPSIPAPPKALQMLVLLIGVVVAASALPGAWLTGFAGDSVLWFSLLFELLVAGAGVLCVLAGLGRFGNGWGLALTCAAGTVLVCAVFAFVEVQANFGDDPAIARFIKPAAAIRVGLAGAVALVASVAVWSRDSRSWGAVIKAVIVLLPVAAVGGWFAFGPTGSIMATRQTPGAEGLRLTLLVVGSLIGVGLVSAAGHLLIRAYEFGRPGNQSASKPSSA